MPNDILERHVAPTNPNAGRFVVFRKLMFAIAVILVCTSVCALGEKPNNKFGIMLMTDGEANTVGQLFHMKLARNFCGEWGYVRIGAGVNDDGIESLVRTVVACRAMHLIPVLTAFRLPDEYYDANNPEIPKRDADGSLTTFSKAYEDWLRKVYARGITIPYFEYGNEVNIGFFAKHPEIYAEMCIAASKGLKKVDPNLSFGTAGMAGSGWDFYDAMLSKVPDLIKYVDHWGMHPYAANHPPGYCQSLGDYGVDSHVYTARTLEKHGVKEPVLIMTETGYELGNQKDPRFPKITEELRAEYLVEAYKKYWLPDPRVRAVMPFMLQDTRWSGWNGWDFIREDFSHTPMYDAIAALPKPEGSDYMPTGPCTVKGRITDDKLGRGIEDFIVWIRRPGFGCYAAITNAKGEFTIANVPAGEYEISGYCDGFKSTQTQKLSLTPGKPRIWNAVVKRTGWLSPLDGKPGDRLAGGWTAYDDSEAFTLDGQTKRTGSSSQRVRADGKAHSIWNITSYETSLPDHVYAAEVWVKTQDLVIGTGGGVTLTLTVTDSFNRSITEGTVKLSGEGDSDWRPLTIALRTVPQGRRLRITLTVDAQSGFVWFDDIFLHDASWPLPSAIETTGQLTKSTISGTVFGSDGKQRLAKATVCTVPLGRWAVTDYLGNFTLDGLTPGKYDLFAFHPDYSSGMKQAVKVDRSSTSGVEITLAETPVPDALIDPGFENIPRINTWFTGWMRFGTTEGINPAGWHKGLIPDAFPEGFQPHSGKGFFGAVAGSNIKDGGIYQTIAVEPDALYEVSVWSMTYQTADGLRGDVANRLGVDPMGGKDPNSPYVIWTPFSPSHKEWTQLKLQVRPVKPKMTIFLHHLQVQGITFNCNFFDDVEVKKIAAAKMSTP